MGVEQRDFRCHRRDEIVIEARVVVLDDGHRGVRPHERGSFRTVEDHQRRSVRGHLECRGGTAVRQSPFAVGIDVGCRRAARRQNSGRRVPRIGADFDSVMAAGVPGCRRGIAVLGHEIDAVRQKDDDGRTVGNVGVAEGPSANDRAGAGHARSDQSAAPRGAERQRASRNRGSNAGKTVAGADPRIAVVVLQQMERQCAGRGIPRIGAALVAGDAARRLGSCNILDVVKRATGEEDEHRGAFRGAVVASRPGADDGLGRYRRGGKQAEPRAEDEGFAEFHIRGPDGWDRSL